MVCHDKLVDGVVSMRQQFGFSEDTEWALTEDLGLYCANYPNALSSVSIPACV